MGELLSRPMHESKRWVWSRVDDDLGHLSAMRRALFLQAVLAILLLIFLVSQVSLKQIASTLSGALPLWFAGGFVLFALADFLRAARFRYLLGRVATLGQLFAIAVVHGFCNNFLPFRLGEASYLYLISQTRNGSVGYGLSSLVLARLADLITVLFLFSLSILLMPRNSLLMIRLSTVIALSSLTIIMILLILVLSAGQVAIKTREVLGKTSLLKSRRVAVVWANIEEALANLESMRSSQIIAPVLSISLAVWLSSYFVSYCLLRAVGVSLSVWQTLFAVSLLQLISIFPIHFLGGLGTTDISWTLLLVNFGLGREEAISLALATHVLFYLYVFVLAAYGIYALKWLGTEREADGGVDDLGVAK